MILLQNIIESNYHYQPVWMLVLIVISVMIIGYLFSSFHTRFMAVMKSFFKMRFANQLAREEHSLTHPASIFLSLNYLITASLFILQLLAFKFSFSGQSFLLLLEIIACLLLVFIVKITAIKILAFIFDQLPLANEYIFTVFLVNQILGIGLLPVIIFISYASSFFADFFIYTGILLMVLSFIIRVGKGAIVALSDKGTTLFYLFLYLCTLEILPLLIAIKLFWKLA